MAAGLDGAVAAVAVDATVSIIINSSGLRSPQHKSSNSGLRSPPRSSSRRKSSISGGHLSTNCSSNYSSSRDHLDILAGGDHRVFVSVAASLDIYMYNVKLYLPHH